MLSLDFQIIIPWIADPNNMNRAGWSRPVFLLFKRLKFYYGDIVRSPSMMLRFYLDIGLAGGSKGTLKPHIHVQFGFAGWWCWWRLQWADAAEMARDEKEFGVDR